MKFEGGVKAAAKMLSGLSIEEKERILKEIALKDPDMAMELKKNIISFEDLKKMTISMLQEFLRDVDLKTLGLALRVSSVELRNFFLENVSKGMKRDIEDILNGPPQKKSSVREAQEKVLEIAKKKVDRGELILNSSDEYV